MKKRYKKITRFISIIVFFISIFMAVTVIFTTAGKITDGDAASELVLARNLAKDGRISLLSDDWYYSTELRVFNTQIINVFLFHLFDDFLFVRIAGAIILNAFLILSFFVFCKAIKLSLNVFFLGGSMLLIPVSVSYARIVLMHNYYIPHLANSFFILGLFGTILGYKEKNKRKSLLLALLFSFCFLSGLGGIRQLLITLAPLLMGCIIIYFLKDSDNSNIYNEKKKGILLSSSCVFFSLIGFFINVLYLTKKYSVGGIGTYKVLQASLEDIYRIVTYWLELCGFRPNMPLFSLEGIGSVLSIFVLLSYLVVAAKIFIITDKKGIMYNDQIMACFFPILLILNTISCFIYASGSKHVLYQIPLIVMAFPMLLSLEKMKLKHNRFLRVVIMLIIIASLINGLVTIDFFSDSSEKEISYSGLSFKNMHLVEQISGSVDFLIENDLGMGYSTFWNANTITEITNGEISVLAVRDNTLTPYKWLTSKSLIKAVQQQENVFLLLTVGEEEKFTIIKEEVPNAVEEYRDEYYVIYSMDDTDITHLIK